MLDKLDPARLQQIIRACPAGILLLDNQGRVSWVNDALGEMLGETRCAQLLNKRSDEVPEPFSTLFDLTTTLHLPGDELHEDLWLMGHRQLLPGDAGQVQYFVDITPLHWLMQERDQLKDELNDVIMVDSETGMRNRKGLYYSLEPQLSRSRRYDRPLTIILLRLDCLDRFRQQYQREDARPVLVTLSQLLSDQLRWADIVGRLNETDFLVVLPEIHADDAGTVVDNLRQQLGELTIDEPETEDFTITARFGIAEWRKGDDMSLLLMRARQMLDDDSDPQPAEPMSHG
ncbi:diguanylate cyclase domain-containing protein [Thiohalophilus sp.]|uniref:sensor domain-containing diguanylate cyclase n=1 Tax=Thiohalophilus sp. TaxID=3028392 RepID=UPI002ACEA9E6|nr:diguanylate cyclase [Thiohalophilus sp.]MDZ7803518.1 diguanylate cyclase [Thiohalophilus sp.]